MAVTINVLNTGNMTLGSGGSTPSATPSPYFTYDSNRVITGLYQGSPNIYYDDGEYTGWTYGGSNVVENYATAIGDYTFDDTGYLDMGIPPSKAITGNITFQNITSIGSGAFFYCSGLTSVTMPNVTSIGGMAFYGCSGLTSVTIGKTVSEVQEMGYSNWSLPSGSTIVCTNGTIPIS